jgi:hypothetical protein
MSAKKKHDKKRKSTDKTLPELKKQQTDHFALFDKLSVRYQLLIALLMLFIAVCVLYPDLVFQNKIFLAGDTQAAASFAQATKQLPAGDPDYPLWNPFLFAGMPSYGSLAYAPNVYPVSLLLKGIKVVLPLPKSSWLLIHILLLGLGVYLLLKDRGMAFPIAVVAACTMMWIPNHVAVGANGHGSQACAVAYIPFALLFWDRMWRGKGLLVNGSALAIVLGFQMLRAHLQISYYTYALIGLHFLFFATLKVVDAVKGRNADGGVLPPLLSRFFGDKHEITLRKTIVEVALYAGVLAFIVGASILISAVLYMPVHDYSQYSIRGAAEGGGLDYDYATSWSLHPKEMLTFVLPYAYGFGKHMYYGHMPFTDYPNYLGLIIVFGAISAIVWARNRYTKFLLFVFILATFVAFGKFVPLLYDLLFKALPYFNKFRVPVMILIVQQTAAVLLFAIGLNAVLRLEIERLKKITLWLMLGSFALLIVVAASQVYWSGGFADSIAGRIRAQSPQQQVMLARKAGELLGRDLLKLSILACSTFVLFFLYSRKMIAKVVFVGILAAISFIDLYMVNRFIVHPEKRDNIEQYRIIREPVSYDDYLSTDPVMSFFDNEDRFFRVFPIIPSPQSPRNPFSGEFTSNRYMNHGISSIGGYHAAKLANYQEFLGAMGMAFGRDRYQLLDMMNVRYLISGAPLPPKFVQRWEGSNKEGYKRFIYENLDAFPRVFFVDSYQLTEEDQALGVMVNSNIDLANTVLLNKRPSIEPISKTGSRADITKYNLNEIHVDAHVDSACILVLSEVYYPRWKVEINGDAGNLMQANYILRGVSLPPGDHKLLFKYDASLFRKSVMITLTTLAILSIVLLVSGIRGARRKANWKLSS